MMRIFNGREGLSRKDDYLPDKLFKPLQGTGPTAGRVYSQDELEFAIDEYYRLSGWDRTTGVPSAETLNKLGIVEV